MTSCSPCLRGKTSLSFFLWLGIEVGFEFFFGDVALDAVFGNFGFGDPEQAVKDDFAEIRIAPVDVAMGASETEAAAAVGAVVNPHHGFVAALG